MHDTEYAGAGISVAEPDAVTFSDNRIVWPPPVYPPAEARRIDVMRVIGLVICLVSASAVLALIWILLDWLGVL